VAAIRYTAKDYRPVSLSGGGRGGTQWRLPLLVQRLFA
jgi:hypothetical protein